MMRLLDAIIEHNEQFVKNKKYEAYRTTKFPNKKLVILTCMDTRLLELLPAAMNVHHGDAKIIKNAGAIISHPFGSIMRSILVAIYELKASEIMVVGHHGCGMLGLEAEQILKKAEARGIDMDDLKKLEYAGVNLKKFLTGVDSVEESVKRSVAMIKHHPLLPDDVPVHGLIICPETGKIDVIVNGYKS